MLFKSFFIPYENGEEEEEKLGSCLSAIMINIHVWLLIDGEVYVQAFCTTQFLTSFCPWAPY